MDGIDVGEVAGAPYRVLDADGSIRAALHDAPPYMQVTYNLLKTSYDTNAASLADNSRVMAETRVDALASRVDEIEHNQQALSNRLDMDLFAMCADISRARRPA